MKINSKLNIVVEVETAEGTVFVHSTPLSREVFEKYFLVISKTFATIISEGLSFISGPRVASLLLKRVAEDLGVWSGKDGVGNGLMAELRRLSSVVLPTEEGWRTVPLQDAINKDLLDDEDVAEVEGLIVFFICASAMSRRNDLKSVLERMQLWGVQITSFNSTEFASSLKTLIAEETSPDTSTSSVPH